MSFNPIYLNEKVEITSENVADFTTKHLALNKEIQETFTQGNRAPIGDGAFNYEGYLKAKVKILWLMKEPYDTNKGEIVEDRKTGGWYFSDSTMYKEKKFGRDRTTWYPIINASHAVISEQSNWDQSQKMSKHNKVTSDVLSHIAYINIQKLASLARERTNNTIIHEAFKKNILWIQRQIDLLNPDIIIGANTLNGNTFDYFKLKGNNFPAGSLNHCYTINGRLFIRAKHPAQTTNKEDVYINDILKNIHEWRKNK